MPIRRHKTLVTIPRMFLQHNIDYIKAPMTQMVLVLKKTFYKRMI